MSYRKKKRPYERHPCMSCKHRGTMKLGMCYCNLKKNFIDKEFRIVWGCNDYSFVKEDKVEQINLFDLET